MVNTLGSVRAFKTKLEAMAMKLEQEIMMMMDEGKISKKSVLNKSRNKILNANTRIKE